MRNSPAQAVAEAHRVVERESARICENPATGARLLARAALLSLDKQAAIRLANDLVAELSR